MLLLLLSNPTGIGQITATFIDCEHGFVSLQDCADGDVTIQDSANGSTSVLMEVNGYV